MDHEQAFRDGAAPGEWLLLDALRRWAAVRMRRGAPEASVRQLFAWRTSPRAGAMFSAWMQLVESQRRRPIQIHCLPCAGASLDERCLVASVGVSAVDLEVGGALLGQMVENPGEVMVLGRSLNLALSASGLALPARLCDKCAARRPQAATLH